LKSVSTLCLFLSLSILGAVPAGAVDVAVDSTGNSYFIGSGPPSYRYRVTKVSPSGALIFEQPLNLTSGTSPIHIAVDAAGYIYVAGNANFDIYSGSEANQAFVAKLTPDATGVLYETYLGRTTNSVDLAVDARGQAYLLYQYKGQSYPYFVDTFQQVSSYSPSGSADRSIGGRTIYVTAMALGPSGDLFTVGWAPDDSGDNYPFQWVILERMDASSGATLYETLIDVAGTVDWFVDVAATPGDGSVVAWTKSDGLHVRELGPAGEKIFSRALNIGAVWLQDVTVASSGEIVVHFSVASKNQVLRLEGGTGKILYSSMNLPPDCSGATASPSVIGSANGKMVLVSILGVTDFNERPALTLTSIFQDEGLTSPSTPDASGLGTSSALVRAARLSTGNGRVYHLRFTATDREGKTCNGTVKVCVPVMQGGTCVDGGARVDSTRTF
jgi:hypothetical protein